MKGEGQDPAALGKVRLTAASLCQRAASKAHTTGIRAPQRAPAGALHRCGTKLPSSCAHPDVVRVCWLLTSSEQIGATPYCCQVWHPGVTQLSFPVFAITSINNRFLLERCSWGLAALSRDGLYYWELDPVLAGMALPLWFAC